MFRTRSLTLFPLILIFLVSGCAHEKKQIKLPAPLSISDVGNRYDLVLDVMPRKVDLITLDSFADAVERRDNGLESLQAIISFRVLEVVEGRFSEKKKKGKGKVLGSFSLNRFIDSFGKMNVRKMFKGNALEVDENLESRWFRVAVADPYDTFGIISWDAVESTRHRLYMTRYHGQRDSYVMVKHEPWPEKVM
jgi:hypothetical protein